MSAQTGPFKLVQTIPMPNVQGRLDKFGGVDVKGRRIFVAAFGDNQNTAEALDLKSGKRVATTGGSGVLAFLGANGSNPERSLWTPIPSRFSSRRTAFAFL